MHKVQVGRISVDLGNFPVTKSVKESGSGEKA
jgi:hypothetical protein